MSLVSTITTIGLILDMIGAILLAKGVFFETIKEIVDKGGVESGRYNSQAKGKKYLVAATRINERCNQVCQTRYGLIFLLSGFFLQIIAQNSQDLLSKDKLVFILIATLILMGLCYIVVTYLDDELRKNALIELVDRILPPGGSLNLPSGRSIAIIEEVCEIFLKGRLSSYSNCFKNLEEAEKTSIGWLESERKRRFNQSRLK